ncbi:aldehyde dehydrogenase family protein [Alphaproteobacteria bacterium]|nr:aldehyde dehydrogenase family protein [Alphaproteobacteria bacterium]
MSPKYDFTTGTGPTFETVNPAKPEQIVGRYSWADEADIPGIVARANAAQAEWTKLPGLERGARLDAFLDAVVANADRIAESIVAEQGKILAEAKGETMKGATEGRFMVGEAARMGATPIATGRPNFSNQILRRPRGTIFCISPWNFPAMTPLRKMCPALAFGNAVIFKPSQFTPAANYILCEIAQEFFPEGLVQMAMIGGRQASALIAEEHIQGVSFTGSVATGRLVGAAAAQNLIPVQLELGGKNAAILNDCHDLDNAVTQIYGAAFQTGGQRCTSISRVLIQRDLAKEAKALFVEKANAAILGDPMDPATNMGPLCNRQHWQEVTATTATAIAEGAVALAGGHAPDGAGDEGGYYYRPTILGDVAHDSTAGQVEIFGPVLSLLEYDDFDEAMQILNGTEFGLTSALFSNQNSLVQRFLAESQNGMMHVNHGTVPDNNMPFGGIKNSGVGAYSVGPTAINFYTSEHAAYVAY